MPDCPHDEICSYYVKPEHCTDPERKTVTHGTVSDPCKSQPEQDCACAVLRAGAAFRARAERHVPPAAGPARG